MTRNWTQRGVTTKLGGALAAIALIALMPMVARAQPVPGQEPGIVAVGFGEASAPATAATLQFLIGPGQFGGFGVPGPPPEAVPEEEAEGDAAVTPGAEEPSPELGLAGPPSVTAEQLDPVVEALVEAGADEEAIEVTVPAAAAALFFGPGGPEIGEIRVAVEQPESSQLADLVQAARDAVAEAGLSVFHVGATFDAADCEALVQEAREAAIADAQARAEGLAEALEITLGDLIQASETPYFGPVGTGTCAGEGLPEDVFGYGPFGPGTDPPFDPAAEAEAEVYVQVSLTYALA